MRKIKNIWYPIFIVPFIATLVASMFNATISTIKGDWRIMLWASISIFVLVFISELIFWVFVDKEKKE